MNIGKAERDIAIIRNGKIPRRRNVRSRLAQAFLNGLIHFHCNAIRIVYDDESSAALCPVHVFAVLRKSPVFAVCRCNDKRGSILGIRRQRRVGIQIEQRANRRSKYDEQATYKHDCNLFDGHNPSFAIFCSIYCITKKSFRNTRALFCYIIYI